MRTKPNVGQILYSLNVNNAARNTKQELTPVTVTKVGRKYFTCTFRGGWQVDYHISGWHEKTEYINDSLLYESEQEYQDDVERDNLLILLRATFYNTRTPDLSLEALRRIRQIVEEDTK